MTAIIRDGRALVRPNGYVFIGATAGGDYPPVGNNYQEFAFAPAKGEGGVLIFCARSNPNNFMLWQFKWEGDRIVIDYELKRVERFFSRSSELGLGLQLGNTHYVTGSPEGEDGHHYKQVDPISLVKCIEGKIDLAMLDKKARLCELRQRRAVRLDDMVRSLEARLADKTRRLDQYMLDAVIMSAVLNMFFRHLPARVVGWFVRKESETHKKMIPLAREVAHKAGFVA